MHSTCFKKCFDKNHQQCKKPCNKHPTCETCRRHMHENSDESDNNHCDPYKKTFKIKRDTQKPVKVQLNICLSDDFKTSSFCSNIAAIQEAKGSNEIISQIQRPCYKDQVGFCKETTNSHLVLKEQQTQTKTQHHACDRYINSLIFTEEPLDEEPVRDDAHEKEHKCRAANKFVSPSETISNSQKLSNIYDVLSSVTTSLADIQEMLKQQPQNFQNQPETLLANYSYGTASNSFANSFGATGSLSGKVPLDPWPIPPKSFPPPPLPLSPVSPVSFLVAPNHAGVSCIPQHVPLAHFPSNPQENMYFSSYLYRPMVNPSQMVGGVPSPAQKNAVGTEHPSMAVFPYYSVPFSGNFSSYSPAIWAPSGSAYIPRYFPSTFRKPGIWLPSNSFQNKHIPPPPSSKTILNKPMPESVQRSNSKLLTNPTQTSTIVQQSVPVPPIVPVTMPQKTSLPPPPPPMPSTSSPPKSNSIINSSGLLEDSNKLKSSSLGVCKAVSDPQPVSILNELKKRIRKRATCSSFPVDSENRLTGLESRINMGNSAAYLKTRQQECVSSSSSARSVQEVIRDKMMNIRKDTVVPILEDEGLDDGLDWE